MGAWSGQHRNVQTCRRKKNNHHIRSFIDFFNIHNLFKVPVNEVINTFTGVIASDDINGDSAVNIAKIISGLDDKKLSEISFRRKG